MIKPNHPRTNLTPKAATSIVLFTPELNGSGAQKVLVNLANGLVKRGHRVEVVALNAQGVLKTDLASNVTVVDLKSGYTLAIPRLICYFRKRRPEQILAFYNAFTIFPLLANWLSGGSIRVIPTLHTMVTNVLRESPMAMLRLAYIVMLKCWRRLPQIVAVSTLVANDLTYYGIPMSRIAVIYNPILDADFYGKVFETRRQPILPDTFWNLPVIIGVGRLCHQKNFDALVRAFAMLRRHVAANLLLVGDGVERKNLEALVQSLGLTSNVAFAGYVDNPLPLISRADLLALSSRYEGLGNVVVEALAVGTPVVAYDHLPVREIPVPGTWMRLVKAGDDRAMARALEETLERKTDLHISDIQSALHAFTVDTVVQQYEDALWPPDLSQRKFVTEGDL